MSADRLGNLLREARVAAGASLREIAARAVIDVVTLGEIERGVVTPGGSTCINILWAIASMPPPPPPLWMCIIKRDTEPADICLGDEHAMRHLYQQANVSWSECYLLRVVDHVPLRQRLRRLDEVDG